VVTLVVTAILAAAVVAACGSSSTSGGSGSSGSSGGSSSASGSSGSKSLPTYTIAYDGPLSGPFGGAGSIALAGLKAAVTYANTLGVAHFKYITADTGGDASKAVNIARQDGQNHVNALLAGTTEFAAVQPVANQYKMFTADGGGFTGIQDKVGNDKEFKWAFCPSTACGASTVLPEIKFLTQVDPTGTIGELYGNDPYGTGTDEFVAPLVKQQFPKVHMLREEFPLNATSAVSQLTKLKNEGATSLLVWTYGSPLVMVMQSLNSMGWYPWVVGPLGVGDPAVVKAIPAKLKGKAIAGGIATSQVSTHVGAHASGLNKIYFDGYQKANGNQPYSGLSTVASYDFDYVVMLAAAIKATGSTDPEKMLAWITAGHTIQTAEGPQKFGPDGAQRIGTSLSTVTVYDPQYPCTYGMCVAPKTP
jgi:ABC-type branched-subunit amino acid transport system substrate-binding protein